MKDRVKLVEIDVTSDTSVQGAAETISNELGGTSNLLYGVVNNAGGTTGNMSARQVLDLNTYGVRRVTEAFLPLVEKEKG